MTNYTNNRKQGLIRTVVLIFIAILILSVLGIDLRKAVESEMTQKNIGYVKATIITVWNRYLEEPAKFLWNGFVKYIWIPAIENLKNSAEQTEAEDESSVNVNGSVQLEPA